MSFAGRWAWGAAVILVGLAGLLWWPGGGQNEALPIRPDPDAAPARERPSTIESDARQEAVAHPSPGKTKPQSRVGAGAPDTLKERSDWIEERYASAQARRAEIKDAATAQHRKLRPHELAQSWGIEFELIGEIGAPAYDRMLYDQGRSNRTRVHWVAPGSYADLAGIERGDIPLSIGGQPVFSPQSVRERKWQEDPGSQVPIEVLRNGQVITLQMTNDELNRGRSGVINEMTLIPFSEEP